MALRISALPAASVDIGDSGMPGSGASKITCDIAARRDGRWEAHGYYSTGCNQGYYQENYGYGPWTGRGSTPAEAVEDMVRRADDDYQDDMRRAGHDAMLECEGDTFATLAAAELARIQDVLIRGERDGCKFAMIAGTKHYVETEERMALRKRAVKMLRRMTDGGSAKLANVSDAELLAELERRGLTVEGE